MREAALDDDIDIRIASAFRDFDRQLHIWNAKARGDRPIQNERGDILDIASLPKTEIMHAILRWSALPGASRHHWGTDMDVYDAAAIDEAAGPKLLVSEYESGGPFVALNDWMQLNLAKFGFFRPYHKDTGGIAPEPWHISYQPLAHEFEIRLNPHQIAELLAETELELREEVFQNLEEIFERYIQIT